MYVKSMVVDDYENFIELLQRELIVNGINYLLIKNDGFCELHLNNSIYKIYDFMYGIKNNALYISIKKKDKIELMKKENTGYKKLTKTMIKNQNKSNKIGNTGKYKQFNKNRGSNI